MKAEIYTNMTESKRNEQVAHTEEAAEIEQNNEKKIEHKARRVRPKQNELRQAESIEKRKTQNEDEKHNNKET